jgi:cation transport regulator ChaB/phage I-like protein
VYKNISELPENVQKIPEKAKTIFMNAFNAAFEKSKNEQSANKIAWSAVEKAGFRKGMSGEWMKASEAKFESLHYITFAEVKNNKVEIMRTGNWSHPKYGNFTITENDIDGFVKHFTDNVRGIDIAIDLEHGETVHAGAAAGWVKSLERSGNSLLAEIEWTDLGKNQLAENKYKYFSPEFTFSYKDNETNQQYTNVLLGGSLTNRPFIKKMAPVLLSEDVYRETMSNTAFNIYQKKEEKEVSELKLSEANMKVLNLSEDATEEAINDAVNKMIETNIKLSESVNAKDTEIKTLKEANKATSDTNIKLDEKIKAIEVKLDEAEWNTVSTKYLDEGKMTPAMADAFKKNYLIDKAGTLALMETLPVAVRMGEVGSSQGESEVSKTATMKFNEKVQSIVKERKVNYGDALQLAEAEFPELCNAYLAERRGVR